MFLDIPFYRTGIHVTFVSPCACMKAISGSNRTGTVQGLAGRFRFGQFPVSRPSCLFDCAPQFAYGSAFATESRIEAAW